jgi:hypothetical protein
MTVVETKAADAANAADAAKAYIAAYISSEY